MLHLSNLHSDYSAPVFSSSQRGKQRGVQNIFASLLRSLGSGAPNTENLNEITKIRIDINADGSLKSPEKLQSKLLQMLKTNASDPRLKNLLNQWNKGEVDIFLPIQAQSMDSEANVEPGLTQKQNSKSIGLLRVFKVKMVGSDKLSQLERNQIGVGFVFDEKSAGALKFTSPGKLENEFLQYADSKNGNRKYSSNSMLLAFSNSMDAPFIAGKVDANATNALQFIHLKKDAENLRDGQGTTPGIQQKNMFGTGINIDENISEKDTGIYRSGGHQAKSGGQKNEFSFGRVQNLHTKHNLADLKINKTSGMNASEAKVSSEEPMQGDVKWNKKVGESIKVHQADKLVSQQAKNSVSARRDTQHVNVQNAQNNHSIFTGNNSQDLPGEFTGQIRQNQNGSGKNQTSYNAQNDSNPPRLVYVNLDGGSKSESLQKFYTKHLSKLLEKLQGEVEFSSVKNESHILKNQNLSAAKKQSKVARTFAEIPKNTFARESVEVRSNSRQTKKVASQNKLFESPHSQRISTPIANSDHSKMVNTTSQANHPGTVEIAASGYTSVKTRIPNDKTQKSDSTKIDVREKSQKSSYAEKTHKSKMTDFDRVRQTDYTPKHSDERSLHTSLESGKQSAQQDGNSILQGKTDLSGVIANSARSSLTQSVSQNHTQPMVHQVMQRFESLVQQLQSSQMQSRGNWLQARIALKPAELGSVMLTLRFKDDVLQGKIFTESKQSKRAIEKHLPAIQEAMNKHQTSVQNIKVEVRSHFDPQQDQPDFQQQFSQQQGEAESRYAPPNRYNRTFGAQKTPEPETVGLSAVQSTLTDNRINFYA